jgi:3'-5' exoribonuclease
MTTTTTRRFITQLGHQESVDEVYLASGKQLRPNRSGQYYLQVALSDRSGSIDARLWNANEDDYRSFENGDYIRVEGSTQVFQGHLQLIANRIRKVPAHEVRQEDFRTLATPQIEAMVARVGEILRQLRSAPLRQLAEAFLRDERFMEKFKSAPAAMKHHHAYQGGLIEHVVNLLELVLRVSDRYPQVDSELLLIGAFLHDVGKVDELCYERDLGYTDAGQLLGHIVMGLAMVDEKVHEVERQVGSPFPEPLLLEIKHMIASHHGQYDFGSPKLPMTLEAVALHHLDTLDAKIHAFDQLIREDPNVDGNWTQYHAALGRKFYRKRREACAADHRPSG